MRFLVIGAGGVGGYYGGLLARAGHDVVLLARGAHLDAIRARGGIELRTPGGSFLAPVVATDDASTLPACDVALLAVKAYSLPDVLPAVREAAGRGAVVLPLLNGVTVVDELIAGGVPREAILPGLTRISAARTAPGVIERRSEFCSIVLGTLDDGTGALRERADRIAGAFDGVGVETRVSDRIVVELWQKFVFITAVAAACGLARSPIGPVRDAPLGRRLLERAVDEVIAVARARRVPLPDDERDRVLRFIESMPSAMKPSFLLDLESGGLTELDALSGTVARFAADAGFEVPVHETAVAALGAAGR